MANLQETIDSSKKSLDSINSTLDNTNSKLQGYTSSVDKYGATLNTTLSIISASVAKTNPGLASAIGSVQKLIPNMTECMNAYKKIGENAEKAGKKATKFGKLMKTATSPAGIMMLITVITTLITKWDSIAAKVGVSSEKIEAFREKANNVINMLIKGVVGVGNALVKFVSTPVKTLASAFKKVFKGDFKGAFDEIKSGIKEQLSFKKNFQEGFESDLANCLATVGKSKKVKDAADSVGEAVVDPVAERLKELIQLSQDYVRDSALQQVASDLKIVQDKINSMSDQDPEKNYWIQVLRALRTQAQELTTGILPKVSNGLDGLGQAVSSTSGIVVKQMEAATQSTRTWKDAVGEAYDDFKANATKYLDSAANLTDGLAQLLESDEKSAKKNAKKIKALKIATATIDMLSGSIKAWNSGMEAGGPLGPVFAAANVAATVALGLANINKIKNTNTESGSSSTPTVSTPTPSVSQSYISNSGYQESVDAAKATAQNTSQSNVVPVLVVDDVNKVQNDMSVVQTNSSF